MGAGWEENLQYRETIAVHQRLAAYLEQKHPKDAICALWPDYTQLGDPFYGYVHRALNVQADLNPQTNCDALVISPQTSPEGYAQLQTERRERLLVLEAEFREKGKLAQVWSKSSNLSKPQNLYDFLRKSH